MTVSLPRLEAIFGALRSRLPELTLRVCTRMPGVDPARIDAALVSVIRAVSPVWVVWQVNHPDELTTEVDAAVGRIIDAGVPVAGQTVLLRGVNDEASVLSRLFEGLVRRRVKPYQLFQTDLVRGTSHLRVPLSRGVAIYRELRNRVSTLALPVYAVDAPGGGGKIALGGHSLARIEDGFYQLEDQHGGVHRYPVEDDRGT